MISNSQSKGSNRKSETNGWAIYCEQVDNERRKGILGGDESWFIHKNSFKSVKAMFNWLVQNHSTFLIDTQSSSRMTLENQTVSLSFVSLNDAIIRVTRCPPGPLDGFSLKTIDSVRLSGKNIISHLKNCAGFTPFYRVKLRLSQYLGRQNKPHIDGFEWEGKTEDEYLKAFAKAKDVVHRLTANFEGIMDNEDEAWQEVVKYRKNNEGKLYEIRLEAWCDKFGIPPRGWKEQNLNWRRGPSMGNLLQDMHYWIREINVPDLFRLYSDL